MQERLGVNAVVDAVVRAGKITILDLQFFNKIFFVIYREEM